MDRRAFLQTSGAALGALTLGVRGFASGAPRWILASGERSRCTLIVNHGGYPSAEAAALASEKVDWFGIDPTAPAVCTESFAATELRRTLCALAGLDPADPDHFPIRSDRDEVAGNLIVVGSERSNRVCAAYAKDLGFVRQGAGIFPGPEGFRIRTVPRAGGFVVLIAGFDRVGTLYGAYDFLESCGVRWLSPGPGGEIVPRRSILEVPDLDRSDAPKFAIRGYLAAFYTAEHTYALPEGNRGNPDFFDWMARNRMNFWSAGERAVPVGEMKKRGLQLGVGGHNCFLLLDPRAPYPYRVAGYPSSDRNPPDPYPPTAEERAGAGKGGVTYSEAHPEWYGLGPDGKRHFPVDTSGYNFCTSNPCMRAEFLKNLVAKLSLGDWSNADSLRWAPEDSTLWCVCEYCRRLGSPTDRNLLMAHAIREELKAAFADGRLKRDVKVDFIIYPDADTMEPPTRPLPAGFDYEGIRGTFDPIHRCYVHGLDDPACTEFNRPFAHYLKAWRDSPYYKGRYEIVEYYNITVFHDLPILFTRTMEHDIRHYFESGARAMIYMHVPTANWGPRALTNCQYARMLWNPDVDIPALVDEYVRLRYENAQGPMGEFYASLERALLNVPEYLSTPGGKTVPSNLCGQLREFAVGKPVNLFPYRHLRLAGDHPPPDDGPSMDDSIGELASCESLLNRALALQTSPQVSLALLEDEGLFRFAAATVRLYYYLARSTAHPLRSPEWVDEIRLASYQAEYLDDHPIGQSAYSGGTMGGMRNALEATGLKDVYLKWKEMLP